MKNLVIDISMWDGDIDLAEWKRKRGIWAVIIKAGGNEKSLGRYTDPKFEENYKKAVAAGLHIGFYYYTVTTDKQNAIKDAQHMMEIVADKDYDMPWYMDVEDPGQLRLSARDLTDIIKAFCDTLHTHGIYSGMYMSGSAWLNNVYNSELRDYANWIAWWRANWPTEAGDIGLWQQGTMRFSDGYVAYDDVSGFCDCDWCCIDYPARIKAGWTKQQEDSSQNNQNGSKKEADNMSGRASDVIGAAYGELGYYAPSDPERGSKYGRWMAQVFGEDWLAGPSNEIWWCCMFVSWCLNQGGVKMDGFPTYNTDVALNHGAKKYAIDKKKVRYGDIVIFNWDWDSTTDHIGFATGEYDGTGFTTIEGNVGNAVKEKYRQLGNVAYVLRPPYSSYDMVDGNTPSVKTDPKNNRDGGKLDVDGIAGWNTIIDLQHQLGTPEDGCISGQYSGNKKHHSGLSNVTYEGGGSQIVRALQKKVGTDVDGHWGPGTSRAVQKWLTDNGYDCGGIDGFFGRSSVKALQNALNDGKLK